MVAFRTLVTRSSPRSPSTSGTVRSLRVLLAASFILPAALFAGAAWQERRLVLHEASQRAERTAEVLEQHAAAAFQAYELIFARIDEHLRSAPDETEAARHAYLASIDHELREVGSLFLIDAQGRVTAHSRYAPVPATNVYDRDYFRMLLPAGGAGPGAAPAEAQQPVLDAGGLAVGGPVTGRFSASPKLNIARAVKGPDGRFAGATAISVSQDYFEAFQRTLSASPDDSMALVRADGVILTRVPALSGRELEQTLAPWNASAVLARVGEAPVRITSPIDGIERISIFRKLAAYPIYVGYGLSTAAVLRPWRVHLFAYGTVALAVALTLSGVTLLAMRTAREEARARQDLLTEMGRREAAEAALRQSQKMEVVGQLAGGIAHDFNNLISAVLGNLELLAKRLPDDPRLRRYVEGAAEGARRGAALTQRLLAFSRRQDLDVEAVDVSRLVLGMKDLLVRSLGSTVSVETRFPARLPPARVDANQLEMALLNLAVNARDAMPKGGTITIEGRTEAVGPGEVEGLAQARYVVVSVSDTGEGMDAGTLARASEPFFTTKPVGKGTGLGLAMVHGFALQSDGTMRIESTPGAGTCVRLWLPVADTPAASAPRPAPAAAALPERSVQVLLVDDDALVLSGMAAMIEDLGHRVTASPTAEEALRVLRSDAAIDLLVTDQVMPGMTGLQLAEAAERLRPGLPMLLASAFAEPSGPEAGRLPRLRKPFTQAALAQAISDVLRAASDPATLHPAARGHGGAAAEAAGERPSP